MTTVAVLMTCHDRREMSVESVSRALAQAYGLCDLTVFVTDDGSTDGTADALAALDGQVTVLAGSGDLFWAAGMALAERAALATDPDFLLWLNDDTFMDPDGLQRMLQAHDRHPGSIVVGATRDPATQAVSYGGRVRTSSWHPQRFQRLAVSDIDQFPDTLNGNAVLVPRAARLRVGPIDGVFPHAYADDDYGLRARKAGVLLVQPPGTVAECAPNPDPQTTLRGLPAWRALQQPKGLPWRAQMRFLRRHAGPAWPVIFVAQQANIILGRRPVSPAGRSFGA